MKMIVVRTEIKIYTLEQAFGLLGYDAALDARAHFGVTGFKSWVCP